MGYDRARRRKRDDFRDVERERHLRKELRKQKREVKENDNESYSAEEIQYQELWDKYDKYNDD